MELNCILWYCIVSYGNALVLHGISLYCMVLQDVALYGTVLHCMITYEQGSQEQIWQKVQDFTEPP